MNKILYEGDTLDNWKNIKVEGIAYVERCVAEFQVWELIKTPYGKFKVKIFERVSGSYVGFTNIQLKSEIDGSPEGGVGYGNTISEALEDTLNYLMKMFNDREKLNNNDFDWVDPNDF